MTMRHLVTLKRLSMASVILDNKCRRRTFSHLFLTIWSDAQIQKITFFFFRTRLPENCLTMSKVLNAKAQLVASTSFLQRFTFRNKHYSSAFWFLLAKLHLRHQLVQRLVRVV
jgi:hypothetical protein